MFLVKYFKMGFIFPKLLTHRNLSLVKTFIFFILLTFIANFPLTWLAFEAQGSRINFIEQNLSDTPDWNNLPSGVIFYSGPSNVDFSNQTYINKDYIYIFGDTYDHVDTTDKNVILFNQNEITFIDSNKNMLISDGYSGFKTEINLNELNFSTGDERVVLFTQFASQIEKSFSLQIILYTVVRNQGVQILTTFIFVILLSFIIQFFRFGFQNFLSYKDGLNFVILASTLPSILALIFGLILPGFAPVVFNLALGLVVMLVLLIFSRKVFS